MTFENSKETKNQEKSVLVMLQIFHFFCTRASEVFPECEWARLIFFYLDVSYKSLLYIFSCVQLSVFT